MADHADDGVGDDVFVYMGGSVPQHLRDTITHVRVHKSVKMITREAFQHFKRLVSIELHDGVEIIEAHAFHDCTSLRGIKLPGVRVIEMGAFNNCMELAEVEFGDKLETIGDAAFYRCLSVRNIKLLKVRDIGQWAFQHCAQLTDVELLSEDPERNESEAFRNSSVRRIVMPLKHIRVDRFAFFDCRKLAQVDLVGGIHTTVSSLLLESWREEMKNEINQINLDLPKISRYDKTGSIRLWLKSVIEKITHYKSEHYALLKQFTTLLELALWKNELEKTKKDDDDDEEEEHSLDEKQPAKKAKICEHGEITASTKELPAKEETVVDASRQKARVTCGANIIIPHVLSFLNDADVFPIRNQNG